MMPTKRDQEQVKQTLHSVVRGQNEDLRGF
jgi:hypothetical protein